MNLPVANSSHLHQTPRNIAISRDTKLTPTTYKQQAATNGSKVLKGRGQLDSLKETPQFEYYQQVLARYGGDTAKILADLQGTKDDVVARQQEASTDTSKGLQRTTRYRRSAVQSADNVRTSTVPNVVNVQKIPPSQFVNYIFAETKYYKGKAQDIEAVIRTAPPTRNGKRPPVTGTSQDYINFFFGNNRNDYKSDKVWNNIHSQGKALAESGQFIQLGDGGLVFGYQTPSGKFGLAIAHSTPNGRTREFVTDRLDPDRRIHEKGYQGDGTSADPDLWHPDFVHSPEEYLGFIGAEEKQLLDEAAELERLVPTVDRAVNHFWGQFGINPHEYQVTINHKTGSEAVPGTGRSPGNPTEYRDIRENKTVSLYEASIYKNRYKDANFTISRKDGETVSSSRKDLIEKHLNALDLQTEQTTLQTEFFQKHSDRLKSFRDLNLHQNIVTETAKGNISAEDAAIVAKGLSGDKSVQVELPNFYGANKSSYDTTFNPYQSNGLVKFTDKNTGKIILASNKKFARKEGEITAKSFNNEAELKKWIVDNPDWVADHFNDWLNQDGGAYYGVRTTLKKLADPNYTSTEFKHHWGYEKVTAENINDKLLEREKDAFTQNADILIYSNSERSTDTALTYLSVATFVLGAGVGVFGPGIAAVAASGALTAVGAGTYAYKAIHSDQPEDRASARNDFIISTVLGTAGTAFLATPAGQAFRSGIRSAPRAFARQGTRLFNRFRPANRGAGVIDDARQPLLPGGTRPRPQVQPQPQRQPDLSIEQQQPQQQRWPNVRLRRRPVSGRPAEEIEMQRPQRPQQTLTPKRVDLKGHDFRGTGKLSVTAENKANEIIAALEEGRGVRYLRETFGKGADLKIVDKAKGIWQMRLNDNHRIWFSFGQNNSVTIHGVGGHLLS